MKLIIAGGRDFSFAKQATHIIHGFIRHYKLNPSEIVSGACGRPENETQIKKFADGIDGDGERWAIATNTPIHRKPAHWSKYGRPAGPKRNEAMAKYADALLLIWNGESLGSANMKKQMQKLRKPIYEVIIK